MDPSGATILDQDALKNPSSLRIHSAPEVHNNSLATKKAFLIMDYRMSKGISKEDLSSIPRFRGLLCAIFVSENFTTDKKYLEQLDTASVLSRKEITSFENFWW